MSSKLEHIPEGARCVFQGTQFRIWHWDQLEFDGNTKVYEVAERSPTLWVIAISDGKILIQHEIHAHRPDRPFWSLPGGKGEFDEDPLIGAKRELSEETGYESDDWTLYRHELDAGKIFWPTYLYIARNARKTHDPHPDGGEKIEPKLVSVEEFFEYVERADFRGYMAKEIVAEMRKDPVKLQEFRAVCGLAEK